MRVFHKFQQNHTHYPTRLACTLGVVICCLLLVSCMFTPPPPSPPPPELTAKAQLATTSTAIDHSVISLYEVERARKPENLFIKADTYPEPVYPSLSRKLNVDWSGPVEPLLAEIAMYTQYRVKVIGHAPAIPVLVNLTDDHITAHELIRHAQAQVYLRADILIFPESGVIELHYLDV